jgi:hypothetical protein
LISNPSSTSPKLFWVIEAPRVLLFAEGAIPRVPFKASIL